MAIYKKSWNTITRHVYSYVMSIMAAFVGIISYTRRAFTVFLFQLAREIVSSNSMLGKVVIMYRIGESREWYCGAHENS